MKGNRRMDTTAKMGFLFAAPAVLYMLTLIGYPMIQNVILSFKNMDVYIFSDATEQNFVGSRDYSELLTGESSILSKATLNIPVFTVCSVFFQFMIGFGLAPLFNEKFPGCSSFRGVTMISWLLPVTVAGLLFKLMFASNGGIINQFPMGSGPVKRPLGWLLKSGLATAAVVVADIWTGVPFNMVLLIIGLITILGGMYKGVSLGGAGRLQTLFLIITPMIEPAVISVSALGFVYTFKVSDLVWVMAKGGPVDSMELVSTYAYRLSSEEFQFSQSAATANILFATLLAVGYFYIKTISSDEAM